LILGSNNIILSLEMRQDTTRCDKDNFTEFRIRRNSIREVCTRRTSD